MVLAAKEVGKVNILSLCILAFAVVVTSTHGDQAQTSPDWMSVLYRCNYKNSLHEASMSDIVEAHAPLSKENFTDVFTCLDKQFEGGAISDQSLKMQSLELLRVQLQHPD